MKIEVKERANNEFYDEVLSVMMNYKKLITNPHTKITGLTKSSITLGLISLIMLVLSIVLFSLDNSFKTYLYLIFLFSFLVCLSIIYYLMIKVRISKLKNVTGKIIVNIEKDYIEYNSNECNYKVDFADIKYIIINKNTISFLPKTVGKALISLNIKYKKDVINTLAKFEKDSLIIDNSKLYEK